MCITPEARILTPADSRDSINLLLNRCTNPALIPTINNVLGFVQILILQNLVEKYMFS